MRITSIETIRAGEFPNLLWVRIHTDEGITGTGETSYFPGPAEAHVHDTIAPMVLGEDPRDIEALMLRLKPYVGFMGTGAEMRAQSAVDIALWDLRGRVEGKPVLDLLGGAKHDRLRGYNTCAGYRYIRQGNQAVSNWGAETLQGPYEDLEGFMHRAGDVALSLLDQRISCMKIWPFDPAAEATGGTSIDKTAMDEALGPFRKIREAAGDKMEVMVELHGLWELKPALEIAKALEEFEPFWIEDPLTPEHPGALSEFRSATSAKTAGGETAGPRTQFKNLIAHEAYDVVIYDPAWCGGITEAVKITAMAEARGLSTAPHDCLGPLEYLCALHMGFAARSTLIQESVRAFYSGWYAELVDYVPTPAGGFFTPPSGAGLGAELLQDRFRRQDVTTKRTSAEGQPQA
ncbi:MAG TPA: mandelate racemase/muconate lactonizing enzyme family protein [Actinomycetota bacterium]|nr:mandelate racemase/muconate lactonizing enzyme family protein [Actinomycetota bacterium]